MASTDTTAPRHESERSKHHGEDTRGKRGDHASSRGQASVEREGHDLVHVPVCTFIKDHFPLLTANEYFRTFYDEIAHLYFEIKNSFIVEYIVGWIMVFMPLLYPAFMLARMWYWTVWALIVKPLFVFWKKVGSVLGINAVLTALWKKNFQLLDFCANYIVNALGSIYKYVKEFWQQIVDDSANVAAQIVDQASETLRTIVRLVKILYTYAQKLGDLVLSEKVEAIIVRTALTLFAVAKWFYHLNKIYQNACDAAIRIIVETWNESSVEIRPRIPLVHEASSSGGVKSSSGNTIAAAHGPSAAGEARHHEASAAGGSSHDDEASRHRKARE